MADCSSTFTRQSAKLVKSTMTTLVKYLGTAICMGNGHDCVPDNQVLSLLHAADPDALGGAEFVSGHNLTYPSEV